MVEVVVVVVAATTTTTTKGYGGLQHEGQPLLTRNGLREWADTHRPTSACIGGLERLLLRPRLNGLVGSRLYSVAAGGYQSRWPELHVPTSA